MLEQLRLQILRVFDVQSQSQVSDPNEFAKFRSYLHMMRRRQCPFVLSSKHVEDKELRRWGCPKVWLS